ncbi:uncharacterized protein LOC144006701 [Festucalex cinctus]
MVTHCCVVGCKSASRDPQRKKLNHGRRFFRFPAWRQGQGSQVSEITKRRRMAWVSAIRRKNITFNKTPCGTRVCNLHFHSGQPSDLMLETHPDWAPSLNLGHNETKPTRTARYARQLNRRLQREAIRKKTEAVVTTEGLIPPVKDEEAECGAGACELTVQKPVQGDIQGGAGACEPTVQKPVQGVAGFREPADKEPVECNFCHSRQTEINRLLEENRALKCELSMVKMNEEFLKDDVKVKYYTGLPDFTAFMRLLTCVVPYIPRTVNRALSPFQMLLLSLMRLRLNLPPQHIAYMFNVNRNTFSNAFSDIINILHARVSPFVLWPRRNTLQASVHQFVNSLAISLGCFEIAIKRPSNPNAETQSNTHKKVNRSIKYLLGVTPQGTISFISKGWEEHVCNKSIIENSGILDKLLPGDLVFPERGFDIGGTEGLRCAEETLPVFIKGPYQLDASDVHSKQTIAGLRMHAKKVFVAIRNKYTMLTEELSDRMLLPCNGEDMTILDKVVSVCCVLHNLCSGVSVEHK